MTLRQDGAGVADEMILIQVRGFALRRIAPTDTP
jgi:hypothetical protein